MRYHAYERQRPHNVGNHELAPRVIRRHGRVHPTAFALRPSHQAQLRRIEFEDEDEFEDEFEDFYTWSRKSADNENKVPVVIRITATFFRGLGREKVASFRSSRSRL